MQNDGLESQVKVFFKKKWVRTALIIDAIAIVIVIGGIIWQATKTATLILNVAPVDARIQVGSNDYQNGTYRMHPGTYNVVVSRDGLDTKSFTINLEPGSAVNFSTFLKVSEDNFDFYTLSGNYESFRKLAEIAGKSDNNTVDSDLSAEGFIAEYQKKYDEYASNKLPINFSAYEQTDGARILVADVTIRRGSDDICEHTLCLEALMALTNDENLINRLLEENGLNPEDYEIHYKFY